MRALLRTALLSLCLFSPASHAAPDKAALVGNYSLQGATEVGSLLALHKDGTYQWMMSYGNQDLASAGVWEVKGQNVLLTSRREPVKFRPFTEQELTFKKQPKPGVWVAVVGVPHQGPVADVEVRFEAKSGKSATATSLPNGDAIVDMPASETWARAGLRPKGTSGQYQWMDVPAARSKARIAAFAVSNPQVLQNGFASMELKREKGALVPTGDTAIRGRYVKEP
ncbi:hypothetical protein KY495_05980 [Massilia sp. PAMC28688]|uniref:hypothetical protein n=1 Tax=Massilia sp. PAMC28688 TaxID=2861283 RepID=UPI001C62C177|nr:hypothetical protein [Massilia sp. PAMC28688]QYF94735.1 hypothetical protein KY495_05980 [Massilia sp. PAMC28688]